MEKTVAVIGALDSKEQEYGYLIGKIQEYGCKVCLVDIGVLAEPLELVPDVNAAQVARTGGVDIRTLRKERNREKSLECMAAGGGNILKELCSQGRIQGVIAMGGGQGTYMAGLIFKKLPIGFPKVLISTIATSTYDQQQFAGINDTMVINPLVDVAGDNSVIRMIMDRGAAAIAGMTLHSSGKELESDKTKVGITMWGVTTPCVEHVKEILEEKGYEVLIFHATGLGGPAMEDLILQGKLAGILDITLAELGNQLTGGTFDKCDYRCTSAAKMGIPQVVIPGGLDMIKYVPPENLPPKFQNRKKYMHNANLLFVRSNEEENEKMGMEISRRVSRSEGPVKILFPSKGISAVDKEGEIFYDPQADQALMDGLKKGLSGNTELIPLDFHINDVGFAEMAANIFLNLMETK